MVAKLVGLGRRNVEVLARKSAAVIHTFACTDQGGYETVLNVIVLAKLAD